MILGKLTWADQENESVFISSWFLQMRELCQFSGCFSQILQGCRLKSDFLPFLVSIYKQKANDSAQSYLKDLECQVRSGKLDEVSGILIRSSASQVSRLAWKSLPIASGFGTWLFVGQWAFALLGIYCVWKLVCGCTCLFSCAMHYMFAYIC